MAKKFKKLEIVHKKWEVYYESDHTISIWRYDTKNSVVNPVEVEILYKDDKTDTKKINFIKKLNRK